MSMSVFSPSLCHLSPFDIVLRLCFKPMLINVRILPLHGLKTTINFLNQSHFINAEKKLSK